MTTAEDSRYPAAVHEEFDRLARECYPCYQCGACTSSCPSGRELYRGPRRIVRLILAGDVEAVLKSDDLWRCMGCGTCTEVCRMEIDVAGIMRRLRQLERRYGSTIQCPERSAADLAATRLRKQPRIDTMEFGLRMLARGHLPRDKAGTVAAGLKLARQKLPHRSHADTTAVAPSAATPRVEQQSGAKDPVSLSFYPGCTLPQNGELHDLLRDVAGGFGVRLEETKAGCCGHPSRGAVQGMYHADRVVHTTCPACDASLAAEGVTTVPLWDALVAEAQRRDKVLHASAPAFVPYVGCLAARDRALAGLETVARLAHTDMRRSYPSMHSGCCGALGGVYRGATKASAMLLEFAATEQATIVSTCSLCCDNVRSAARELRIPVDVRFWPEFFRAAPRTPEDK